MIGPVDLKSRWMKSVQMDPNPSRRQPPESCGVTDAALDKADGAHVFFFYYPAALGTATAHRYTAHRDDDAAGRLARAAAVTDRFFGFFR